MADQGGGAVPRVLRFAEEEFAGLDEPVPMVVQSSVPDLAAGLLRPLPPLGRGTNGARERLTAGGRFLMFEQVGKLADESIPLTERHRSRGIYRLDLSDMTITRACFDPWDDWRARHAVAGSPDGRHVLIAANWKVEPWKWAGDARRTFWLAGFDDTPPRELLTITGGTLGLVDDAPVQWSPDGSRVALSISEIVGGRPNPADPDRIDPVKDHRVLVLDPWTGQEVARSEGPISEGPTLVGSASFSPDGTRLLTAAAFQPVRILHLPSGRFDPIPALSVPHHSPPTRHHRPLGFADDEHLITATQRGKRMNLWRTPIAGGDPEPLLRFTGNGEMHPTLAQMPPEYWRTLAAERSEA